MGANLASLHIWTKGELLESTKEQVIAYIQAEEVKEGGQVAEEDEIYQWSIEVAIVPDKPWVSIYDEAGEQGDFERLEKYALMLSKVLDTYAFIVQVYDSDILTLHLYYQGEEIDAYNSCPDYWKGMDFAEELTEEDLETCKGKADKWEKVLAKDHTVEELRRIWDEACNFEEEKLIKMSMLLNQSTEQIAMSYSDLGYSEECEIVDICFK